MSRKNERARARARFALKYHFKRILLKYREAALVHLRFISPSTKYHAANAGSAAIIVAICFIVTSPV